MRDEKRDSGFVVRPHPLFVVFFPASQYIRVLVLTGIAWFSVWLFNRMSRGTPFSHADSVLMVGGGVLVARFVWAVLQWLTRGYGVEDRDSGSRRVVSTIGVLNRTRSEVEVDAVRNIVVDRPFVQRFFGLGSVGFATAGTGGYEVVWRIVRDPQGFADRVRSLETRVEGGSGG